MAKVYLYQAKDSVTGGMYYWNTSSASGTGYTGPNTATELTRLAEHGEDTSGGGGGGGGMPELTISNTTSGVVAFDDHSRKRYTGSPAVNITLNLSGAKDGKIATRLFPVGSISTFVVDPAIDPSETAALIVDDLLVAYQMTLQYFDGGCVMWGLQKVVDV